VFPTDPISCARHYEVIVFRKILVSLANMGRKFVVLSIRIKN